MQECLGFSILRNSQEISASLEEVRIIVVVDGKCTITLNSSVTLLDRGDYLLLNTEEKAFVEIFPNSYVAVLSVDYFQLCQSTGKWNVRFNMNSRDSNGKYYTEMRFMLQGLLLCLLSEQGNNSFQSIGLSYLIKQGLISHFILPDEPDTSDSKEQNAQKLLRYVRLNFRNNISITDLAKDLFCLDRSCLGCLSKLPGRNFRRI